MIQIDSRVDAYKGSVTRTFGHGNLDQIPGKKKGNGEKGDITGKNCNPQVFVSDHCWLRPLINAEISSVVESPAEREPQGVGVLET